VGTVSKALEKFRVTMYVCRLERFSTKIKHMYERDTNVQEISDTFRNALSQSMDKYIPSKKF
jgi:hypothetical protein